MYIIMLFQLFPELAMLSLSILFLLTKNAIYSVLLAGSVINIFVGVLLKKMAKKLIPIIGDYGILRPDDAFGCNMDQQVSNKGEIGMPSNHSMLAGYLFISLYKKHPLAYIMLLIPFSRLRNDQFPIINHGDHACHTWGQVIFGFLLGIGYGKVLK